MGARPHSERAPKNNGGAPSFCGRFGDFLLFFIAAKSWWFLDPLAVIHWSTTAKSRGCGSGAALLWKAGSYPHYSVKLDPNPVPHYTEKAGSGSALKWKAGSGSALQWKAGSKPALQWKAESGIRFRTKVIRILMPESANKLIKTWRIRSAWMCRQSRCSSWWPRSRTHAAAYAPGRWRRPRPPHDWNTSYHLSLTHGRTQSRL